MTNEIEQFTAPGKYYIDKFFELAKTRLNIPKDINNKEQKNYQNPNYQLKQPHNRMQNK